MGCGVYWQQVHTIDDSLDMLRPHLKIPGISDVYSKLYTLRGQLMARVGFKFPRVVTQMLRVVGLSPGSVTLWLDVESGWMSEARARPGAPPVYKAASDEVALTILKQEITPGLERELLTPDEYLGE